jgi:hypothetical protein
MLPLDRRIVAQEVPWSGLNAAQIHIVKPFAQVTNTLLDGRGRPV